MLVLWHSNKGTAVIMPRDLINSLIKKKVKFYCRYLLKTVGGGIGPSVERRYETHTPSCPCVGINRWRAHDNLCPDHFCERARHGFVFLSGTLGNYH